MQLREEWWGGKKVTKVTLIVLSQLCARFPIASQSSLKADLKLGWLPMTTGGMPYVTGGSSHTRGSSGVSSRAVLGP